MTAASANKVTVPGDNRLDELKLGNKTPFWHKIPIIKELRVAVGWQKGMLITGLVLTAFFLLVAIFAPLMSKIFRVNNRIAKGVAIGTCSHAVGTTKALEMGELEGAMSGVSIAVSGLLTTAIVIIVSCFA